MGSVQGPADTGPIGDLLPSSAPPQPDEHQAQPRREPTRAEQTRGQVRHRKKPSSVPVVVLALALVAVLAVAVFLLVRSMRSESSAPAPPAHSTAYYRSG
jgi:anti-sigma-K factor RskA